MTPREKWREECIQYIISGDTANRAIYNLLEDDKLVKLLEARVRYTNYLISEYIINVKTSDDEKSTEISDNQQQQG